jgi:hypothetical protein
VVRRSPSHRSCRSCSKPAQDYLALLMNDGAMSDRAARKQLCLDAAAFEAAIDEVGRALLRE